MNSGEFYNGPVADWAKRNIKNRVEIRPHFSSTAGKVFAYSLFFVVPLAFLVTGVVLKVRGIKDQTSLYAAFACGFGLLVPFGVLALLAALTRAGLAQSLDSGGVNASRGRKFHWGKLHYVDHVSKHFRASGAGQRVRDNQLELVFENGKVIIPPLIQDREKVWELINSMPAQTRDDGVPRESRAAADAGSDRRGREDLLKTIVSLARRGGPKE